MYVDHPGVTRHNGCVALRLCHTILLVLLLTYMMEAKTSTRQISYDTCTRYSSLQPLSFGTDSFSTILAPPSNAKVVLHCSVLLLLSTEGVRARAMQLYMNPNRVTDAPIESIRMPLDSYKGWMRIYCMD
jgi:hypothetical protein